MVQKQTNLELDFYQKSWKLVVDRCWELEEEREKEEEEENDLGRWHKPAMNHGEHQNTNTFFACSVLLQCSVLRGSTATAIVFANKRWQIKVHSIDR